MGAGSAALIWYACCCSFVAFTGIVASGLLVYGRTREARARQLREADDAAAQPDTAPAPPEPEATADSTRLDPDAPSR